MTAKVQGRSLSFEDIIRPLSKLTRFLGFAPFTSEKLSRKAELGYIAQILLIVTLFTSTLKSVADTIKVNSAEAVRTSNNLYIICVIGFIDYAYLGSLIFCKKITKVITTIIEVDRIIINSGCFDNNKEYQKEHVFIIKLIIMYIFNIFIRWITYFILISDKDIWKSIFYTGYAIGLINLVQFVFIINIIRRRYFIINNFIKVTITKAEKCEKEAIKRYEMANLSVQTSCEILQRLESSMKNLLAGLLLAQQCHMTLANVANIANKCYSLHNLILILRALGSTTILIFMIGSYIIANDATFIEGFSSGFYVYFVVAISANIGEISLLATYCSSAKNEALKTGKLLSKSTLEFPRDNETDNCVKFSIQLLSAGLLHQNMSFSAFTLFEINNNLIIGAIGAIAKYMVVILQFQLTES